MAMAAAQTDWTIDMLDALTDDVDRHEIIDGELFVTPAPGEGHQLVVFQLLTMPEIISRVAASVSRWVLRRMCGETNGRGTESNLTCSSFV